MGTKSSPKNFQCFQSNVLTVTTIFSIVLGIGLSLILRSSRDTPWPAEDLAWIKLLGEMFLRTLKAISLPLILSSVIAALGSLDLRLGVKVGMRTILYYLVTTISAVSLGIFLAVAIHPGQGSLEEINAPSQAKPVVLNQMIFPDMLRNMFPSNLVEATMFQHQSAVETSRSVNQSARAAIKLKKVEATNMLGLLMFSVVCGLALASMGNSGKSLLKLTQAMSKLTMIISSWILCVTPIGIFCMLTSTLLEAPVLAGLLSQSVSFYVFTVLLGLFFHGLVVLPALYFLISGTLPFKRIARSGHALATAFGTSSSISTVPATISCTESHGVDPRIARFVVSLGSSVNLNGTALYESVSAIFLCQFYEVTLDFNSLVSVSLIVTICSIGASGIPQAGLATMAMLVQVLGLPAESLAILISVDWILHRFRTAINVLGDILAANLIDNLSREDIEKSPSERIITSERAPIPTLV